MPDNSDDRTDAEHEAELASAFFDKLIAEGKSEQIAAQLTSAYILGRIRRESNKEPWDL